MRNQKPESIFVVLKSEILIETNERFSLVEPRPVKQRSRSQNKDKWYDFTYIVDRILWVLARKGCLDASIG